MSANPADAWKLADELRQARADFARLASKARAVIVAKNEDRGAFALRNPPAVVKAVCELEELLR